MACARAEPVVVIALAWPEQPPYAVMVAQAAIESTAKPGDPVIVVESHAQEVSQESVALETSVDQALRIAARPEVVAVVGHPSSTETVLAAPIYAESGIPLLVPTATTRRLADAGPLVFPLVPNDSLEGEFIADFAVKRLNARSAVVFYVVDDYGAGLAAGVGAAFDRLGVTVLERVPVRLDHQCPPFGESNPYDVQVDASLRARVPDVVVVAGRRWEVGCITRAVAARAAGTPVIGGDGATPPDSVLLETAGRGIDRLYLVAFWADDRRAAQSATFSELFRQVSGRAANPGDALAHDAIMLAVTAVREAGGTRRAVQEYLRSLGLSRPPYAGATGAISFQAGAPRPLLMTEVRSGIVRRVEAP